ncbi:DMT family transporter [Paenibacillus nanensis]|uniref:DMT family transporter n=1 Tax=Paenibacillus nanensis TaxID=393251 RepID=A0A3A1UW71_9BACL|nr:DMT family transporter [Paenibacillus nanensis]RIX51671.1 DMT family transporter [Paenibacillus nanensis]
MWHGLLLAAFGGALVGMQNIFNKRVGERASSWTTTTLVLGMGFAASLLMGLLTEGGQLFHLQHMKLWYGFSGMIGVGVVVCITQATKLLGPTYATSIALISQISFALWWDTQGWMGLEKVPFTLNQAAGVLIIICGILMFKFGDRMNMLGGLFRVKRLEKE